MLNLKRIHTAKYGLEAGIASIEMGLDVDTVQFVCIWAYQKLSEVHSPGKLKLQLAIGGNQRSTWPPVALQIQGTHPTFFPSLFITPIISSTFLLQTFFFFGTLFPLKLQQKYQLQNNNMFQSWIFYSIPCTVYLSDREEMRREILSLWIRRLWVSPVLSWCSGNWDPSLLTSVKCNKHLKFPLDCNYTSQQS